MQIHTHTYIYEKYYSWQNRVISLARVDGSTAGPKGMYSVMILYIDNEYGLP
jgi:hypothetical protein